MPFTDKDRNMMIATHTIVKAQSEDIVELKKEDKLLHHRINVVRNLYGAIITGVAGLGAYIKIKMGG